MTKSFRSTGIVLAIVVMSVLMALTMGVLTAGADEIAPFDSMFLNIVRDDAGQYVMVIGGSLNPETPLPVDVEIAVPKGSPVFWMGEVLGGDVSQDVQLPQDKKRTEGNFDIYSATLTRAHDLWIEYYLFGSPFKQEGNQGTVDLSYTPLHDISQLTLSAMFQQNMVPTEQDLVHMGTNPQTGDSTFGREMGPVKAGETASTTIAYTIASTGGAASTTNTTVVVLIIVIVALGAGLMFVLLSKRMKK